MSPWRITLVGLVGLASAMGIGRFAFTPALPLMQQAGELNLIQGSWLASVNYLGYLLGALLCIWLRSRPAVWARWGLLTVALVTLLMAVPGQPLAWWMLWRLLAGVASAFVLVGLSAWCLGHLEAWRAGYLSGWVFAGVGTGVMLAGLAGLGAGVSDLPPDFLWLLLGLASLVVWLVCRSRLAADVMPVMAAEQAPVTDFIACRQAPTEPPRRVPVTDFTAVHWWLIVCYGIFGIGYILPATFLPAMAREQLADPLVFGWVWPVFGLAAAGSTLLVSYGFRTVLPKTVWAVTTLIMALGVILPVLSTGLLSLLVSALCVGGTFMVMTQAGMQEAKSRGGARLIAAMTASFAAGQVIGPLLLSGFSGSLMAPSVLAAGLLVCSFFVLIRLPAVKTETLSD